MGDWIYFIHPDRDDFAATMTDVEREVWGRHFEHLERLLAAGTLVLAGPTLGRLNTGICIFSAANSGEARAIMESDPVIAGNHARGELRPFRISLLAGRD